jgi:hypothetical protein
MNYINFKNLASSSLGCDDDDERTRLTSASSLLPVSKFLVVPLSNDRSTSLADPSEPCTAVAIDPRCLVAKVLCNGYCIMPENRILPEPD